MFDLIEGARCEHCLVKSSNTFLNVILMPSDPELPNFENKTNWVCKSGHLQPPLLSSLSITNVFSLVICCWNAPQSSLIKGFNWKMQFRILGKLNFCSLKGSNENILLSKYSQIWTRLAYQPFRFVLKIQWL